METLNSSGKSYSSKNKPWSILENHDISFNKLPSRQKDEIVRAYAHKIKINAARLKHRLPRHVEVNELISAGTLGLMEALGNFDSKQGIKFETFADNRIRGAMLDELRKMDWFSRGLRKKVKRLEECIRNFEQNSGKQPTYFELKKLTGFSIDEIEEGMVALQNQICLSLEAVHENFTLAREQYINNEPQRSAVFKDLVNKVAILIDKLTNKEKLVLSLYYDEELTMKEVALVLEITEGRVSQLHSQAIGKIQKKFTDEHEQL